MQNTSRFLPHNTPHFILSHFMVKSPLLSGIAFPEKNFVLNNLGSGT